MALASGINHIATLTSDMDRTVGFYERVFDAVVTDEIAPSDDHPWLKVVDVGGGASLNVFEVPAETILGDRRRPGGRGAVDHFGFGVRSLEVLEEVRTRLIDAGADEVGEIQPLGGEWSLFFRDPDGLELEVCCAARPDEVPAGTAP